LIISKTLNILCDRGYITSLPFVVTDSLRVTYATVYAELTNGDYHTLTSSNKKYALKLAGLNLLKFGGLDTAGFVYCISNPSFAGYVKVGITKDISKRLASYQTYDPHRSYRLETYRFVQHKREIEKSLLNKYGISTDKGEWVSDLSVIDYVKSLY
jgi:hypothetical protein